MPCFYPLKGWYSREANKSGKYSITFNPKNAQCGGDPVAAMKIPCGKCVGCREDRTRSWAIRCLHESTLHTDNCFITLTYNKLPKNGSLNVIDWQKFMKRLREWRFRHDPKGRNRSDLRFYMCGEYGEKLGRPHYHALIFGFNFEDRKLWSEKFGYRLYRSKLLEKLWRFGFSRVGDVSYESAAYVARYIQKKIDGEIAPAYYCGKKQEFNLMSRRPGIARKWIEKYSSSVYPHDYIALKGGFVLKPPKYYDSVFDIENKGLLDNIKRERRIKALEDPNNSVDRLRAREVCLRSRLKNLKRGVEDGSFVIHRGRS